MTRNVIGEIIFWATFVFALILYSLTAPAGLPWGESTNLALAWSGVIPELPAMPHPIWGYFVWLFGGHFVALSAAAAAVAGGLVGAVVNRHFGWRFGVAAALVWVMLPGVWNRAITGSRGICVVCGIVTLVWLAHAAFLFFTRHARAARKSAPTEAGAKVAHVVAAWRGWVNRIAAWVTLGAAAVFAIVSLSMHDYRLGEAASAYARATLSETGDKLVILNGVADDQMVWEAERLAPGASGRLLLFRNDAAYRTQLVARVKREWPAATNLWVAAQIGSEALADVAFKNYGDRVYVMTGKSTTPEKWAMRWSAMAAYLDSSDRFIPVMRRAFAFEGNVLANELQSAGKLKEAWNLYWRLYTEVDPGNPSALVNLSEMLRRGQTTSVEARQRIERDVKALLHEGLTRRQAASLVAACGPVMPDSEALAEMRARIAAQLKEMKEKGVVPELSPEWRSLIEWNNDMIHAHDRGDIDKAVRIARTILSNPEWRSYIPANAVMGSAMALEGDYVSAETFYRVAIQGKGQAAPPPVILNDYADVLRNLGRYDEAERYAREAVEKDGGKTWFFKLTLAQVLRDAKKNPDEMKAIVDVILKESSVGARRYVRQEFGLEK